VLLVVGAADEGEIDDARGVIVAKVCTGVLVVDIDWRVEVWLTAFVDDVAIVLDRLTVVVDRTIAITRTTFLPVNRPLVTACRSECGRCSVRQVTWCRNASGNSVYEVLRHPKEDVDDNESCTMSGMI
jgi:hypothetical protein